MTVKKRTGDGPHMSEEEQAEAADAADFVNATLRELRADLGEAVEEPVVVEVMRPGYRFKDRLLRPASVKVAK